MKDLDEFAMAGLARELAMNIRNYQAVFEDYGITEEDYYEISKNEFFQKAKTQFALQWNSALSVHDRVKLISASYVEKGLPVVMRRALKESEPLAAVVDVMKLMSKNAGLGEGKGGENTSEKFVITINLGADKDGKEIIETYSESIAVEVHEEPKDVSALKVIPSTEISPSPNKTE